MVFGDRIHWYNYVKGTLVPWIKLRVWREETVLLNLGTHIHLHELSQLIFRERNSPCVNRKTNIMTKDQRLAVGPFWAILYFMPLDKKNNGSILKWLRKPFHKCQTLKIDKETGLILHAGMFEKVNVEI